MILHPRRLGDPYVTGWVLKQIKYAREVDDQSRADELEALFDDLILRRIIETGSQILVADIFVNLRTNLFISLQKYMLDNWPSWKGYTAHRSAVKLAELAPQDFRRILTRFVERPNILRDKSMLRGAFDAAALMGKDATEIARALVTKVEERGDRMEWWSFLADMVHTATDSDADTAVALLVRGFEGAKEEHERRSLEASLSAAYEVITCDLPYLDHIQDISEKQSKQGFRQLAELFRSGAPLESIDAAARAKGHKRLAAALELLPEEGQSSKAVGFARKLADAAPKLPDSQECAMLASFLLAATAAHYARESFAFEGYDMSSLTSIASYDIVDLPCYPAVVDSLQRFHIDDVAPAMIKALKKGRNHFGGVHLTRMMGDLKHPGFVDPLIQCISESSGDFISESAMGALAKIGAEARQTIISRWSGLDSSQKIYGYGVFERIGGDEKTVQFLAGCFAEARPEPNILECWCSAAEGVPDRRLLDILEGELHRELYVVDDTYSTLCAILDIDRPQLKEARKRAERQDDLVLNKSLDELTIADVMDKQAKMELRCESCGETNQFEMPGIFISPKHPKDGFCIGGDITCPSCGSYGPFEPGKMGMMAATAELLKFTMAAKSGVEYRGPLQFFTSSLHDGRLVSPSTALKEYRRRVECNPASVPDSLGLGNIYVKIGSLKLAADCFIRCLALDPRCAEAAFSLALIRFNNGDLASAYKLLDDAWQLREQWRFHRLTDCSPEDLTAAFVDLHNIIGVKLGKPKLSMPGRGAPSIAIGKVGRNAPCPCGSGKKYKKCCGTGGPV